MQVKSSIQGKNSCNGTKIFIWDREKFVLERFVIERFQIERSWDRESPLYFHKLKLDLNVLHIRYVQRN